MVASCVMTALTGGRAMSWGFACGRVSVWESEFLSRAFFLTLMRSADGAEFRRELARAPAYRMFASNVGPRDDLAAAGRTYFQGRREDLLSICPKHAIGHYFRLGDQYRKFRQAFTRLATADFIEGVDLEPKLRALFTDPRHFDAMTEHRAMLYRVDAPQNSGAPERSLYLDSLACTMIDLYGREASEPLVKRFLRDRAVLASWSAILRARRNKTPLDRLLHWFVFGEERRLVAAVLADEKQAVKGVLPFLSEPVARALEKVPAERIEADVEAAAADALRVDVLECKNVVSGAERVLAYLEALTVEETNMMLCLAAVSGGLDRDVAAQRLRREYA